MGIDDSAIIREFEEFIGELTPEQRLASYKFAQSFYIAGSAHGAIIGSLGAFRTLGVKDNSPEKSEFSKSQDYFSRRISELELAATAES
jgi:hypothetical protein